MTVDRYTKVDERGPYRETGVGPAHGDLHGWRLLGRSLLHKNNPLNEEHKNDNSHQKKNNEYKKSSSFIG